jgi:hypothetical protein
MVNGRRSTSAIGDGKLSDSRRPARNAIKSLTASKAKTARRYIRARAATPGGRGAAKQNPLLRWAAAPCASQSRKGKTLSLPL